MPVINTTEDSCKAYLFENQEGDSANKLRAREPHNSSSCRTTVDSLSGGTTTASSSWNECKESFQVSCEDDDRGGGGRVPPPLSCSWDPLVTRVRLFPEISLKVPPRFWSTWFARCGVLASSRSPLYQLGLRQTYSFYSILSRIKVKFNWLNSNSSISPCAPQ